MERVTPITAIPSLPVLVLQGNALALSLGDESVDLIITSPPYFALRSYRDEGTHYEGQIGSESTPTEFLEALWAATVEMVRVLKPSGSIWVNLGDKYAGSGGHNNANMGASPKSTLQNPKYGQRLAEMAKATRRNAPDRYNQNAGGIPAKSLMGLPWRYATGCIDRLGLILRAEVIWSKPNGLPESVTDRVRRSHEQWFHFTKSPRYFSAVDEVREAHSDNAGPPSRFGEVGKHVGVQGSKRVGQTDGTRGLEIRDRIYNPLGKLPGSVWTIPSEPLIIPEAVQQHYNLPDHFAAFPQELPRRIILGWSPSGICVECGEGRRPVVEKELVNVWHDKPLEATRYAGQHDAHQHNRMGQEKAFGSTEATITGYACACTPWIDHPPSGKSPIPSGTAMAGRHRQPSWSEFAEGERGGRVGSWREYHLAGWTPPPTRPAVVLDPFGGTGTVAMVARALGRVGISVDLSWDYSRLAKWRIRQSGHWAKAESRTWQERQGALF